MLLQDILREVNYFRVEGSLTTTDGIFMIPGRLAEMHCFFV